MTYEESIAAGKAMRAAYYREHSCCPACGGNRIVSTLIGYVLDINAPEKYRDENRCSCKCGWQGIAHDLKPC